MYVGTKQNSGETIAPLANPPSTPMQVINVTIIFLV